jgi:signal transduction histidine kinase
VRALDTPVDNALPVPLRLAAYRIVEEALGNVLRHADATHAEVVLQMDGPDRLVVRVRDNGRGCDPAQVRPGIGLSSIAGHADRAGGTWTIESAVGAGTTLSAVLPLSAAAGRVTPG